MNDHVTDLILFFNNNLYTMDLLLNKSNRKPMYYKSSSRERIEYKSFIVDLFKNNIYLKFSTYDDKKIIDVIRDFDYEVLTTELAYTTVYFFTIKNISYNEINKLKELILEIYKKI